jgi:hypothetical protein
MQGPAWASAPGEGPADEGGWTVRWLSGDGKRRETERESCEAEQGWILSADSFFGGGVTQVMQSKAAPPSDRSLLYFLIPLGQWSICASDKSW